jgi:hypothetical protein
MTIGRDTQQQLDMIDENKSQDDTSPLARFTSVPPLLSPLPDMLTVVAPLSREEGDGFLTSLGNFPREIFPSLRS